MIFSRTPMWPSESVFARIFANTYWQRRKYTVAKTQIHTYTYRFPIKRSRGMNEHVKLLFLFWLLSELRDLCLLCWVTYNLDHISSGLTTSGVQGFLLGAKESGTAFPCISHIVHCISYTAYSCIKYPCILHILHCILPAYSLHIAHRALLCIYHTMHTLALNAIKCILHSLHIAHRALLCISYKQCYTLALNTPAYCTLCCAAYHTMHTIASNVLQCILHRVDNYIRCMHCKLGSTYHFCDTVQHIPNQDSSYVPITQCFSAYL